MKKINWLFLWNTRDWHTHSALWSESIACFVKLSFVLFFLFWDLFFNNTEDLCQRLLCCNQGKIIIDVYFVTMHIISLKLYLLPKTLCCCCCFFFFLLSLWSFTAKTIWRSVTWSSCTPARVSPTEDSLVALWAKVSVEGSNYQLSWDFEFVLLVTCWALWFFDWVSFFFYSGG